MVSEILSGTYRAFDEGNHWYKHSNSSGRKWSFSDALSAEYQRFPRLSNKLRDAVISSVIFLMTASRTFLTFRSKWGQRRQRSLFRISSKTRCRTLIASIRTSLEPKSLPSAKWQETQKYSYSTWKCLIFWLASNGKTRMRNRRVLDPVLLQHCQKKHSRSRAQGDHEFHRQRCQRFSARIPRDDYLQDWKWKWEEHERAAGGIGIYCAATVN